MIFFGDNKNKIALLVLLTVFFSAFIIYQWFMVSPPVFKINSSKPIENTASSSPQNVLVEIKNGLEFSRLQLDELKAAWGRQQKQEELLDLTRQRLGAMASTTTSTIK